MKANFICMWIKKISYPGCQRLSCAVSGFGQASTCGRSRKFCWPAVDTEECRLTPKTFPSGDRSGLTFRFLFQQQTRIPANWHEKPLHPTQPRLQSLFLLRKCERPPPYFLREKPQGLGCIPREAKMGGASLVTKTFPLETANWTNLWSRLV